jgi:hypothetical protein
MASVIATMMRMKQKAKAEKRKMAMAASRDEADMAEEDEIQFSARVLPPKGFDVRGFFVYCVFLAFFLFTSLAGRDQDTYRLCQFTRDLAGVDQFMTIDNGMKYSEWLEYHFFYGLGQGAKDTGFRGFT